MKGRPFTGATLDKLEALVQNPVLFDLAEQIPIPAARAGGRPRDYPAFVYLLFGALVSVYNSARQAEAELAHPTVWALLRTELEAAWPGDESRRLPAKPMRRHHWSYFRDRYLCDPHVWERVKDAFVRGSCRQAVDELGLCRPGGPGSLTHPDLSRCLYGDGKVITPLFKHGPGDTWVHPETGEVRQRRFDPDAKPYKTGGSKDFVVGSKIVHVGVRSDQTYQRMILSLDLEAGGEAKVAVELFREVAALLPGAQTVTYDRAFRGTHLNALLHEIGLLPICKVLAASKGGGRAGGPRKEHVKWVETKKVLDQDHGMHTVPLYARAGALCWADVAADGSEVYVRLKRRQLKRALNRDGTYRFYGMYRLPSRFGRGVICVRLDQTAADRLRGFNRTEYLRGIPPGDPDFAPLYGRRSDSESINRGLDDSMWLGRAHSVGALRQRADFLGFALSVNSMAVLAARRGRPPDELAA